jgi:NAD(P)-dependent dehydrogenase (short-subunit alcohol dehydrogenase family)
LLKSADPRLLFVTSGTSILNRSEGFALPIDRSPEPGWPKSKAAIDVASYRSAKTGLNMMMREWERTLKNDGVKVFAISPGFLATGLGGLGAEALRKFGASQPETAGPLFRDVIEGRRDADAGRIVKKDGVQEW